MAAAGGTTGGMAALLSCTGGQYAGDSGDAKTWRGGGGGGGGQVPVFVHSGPWASVVVGSVRIFGTVGHWRGEGRVARGSTQVCLSLDVLCLSQP